MRMFGWLGALLLPVLGIAVVLGVGFFFAPVAPSLALLWLLPIVVGIIVVMLLIRPLAFLMGWGGGLPTLIAAITTLAPFAGLAAWWLPLRYRCFHRHPPIHAVHQRW